MLNKLLATALIAAAALPATAAYVEAENNGSITAANVLNLTGDGSTQVTGAIGANPIDMTADFDYFRLGTFAVGGVISASTASNFDPYIGLYNSAGALVAADDDSGGGLQSAFTYNVTTQDVYTLVVRGYGSGFANDPFSLTPGNANGSQGSYTANLTWRGALGDGNKVPEPGTLALLAVALTGAGLMRRRAPRA